MLFKNIFLLEEIIYLSATVDKIWIWITFQNMYFVDVSENVPQRFELGNC